MTHLNRGFIPSLFNASFTLSIALSTVTVNQMVSSVLAGVSYKSLKCLMNIHVKGLVTDATSKENVSYIIWIIKESVHLCIYIKMQPSVACRELNTIVDCLKLWKAPFKCGCLRAIQRIHSYAFHFLSNLPLFHFISLAYSII